MDEFLKQINQGYDGLVRKVVLNNLTDGEVRVSVLHKTNGWINVTFMLEQLTEFNVEQKINTTNCVLSGGIKIKTIDKIQYIDFSPYSDEIDTVSDFRKSDLYFAAREIKFIHEPYNEK